MNAFDLIIFDCDGVLIESETIAQRVESALFRERGADISPQDVGRRYTGTTEALMHKDIEERFGITIDPVEISAAFDAMFWPLAERELKATPGVIDFIETLSHDRCVCSNSPSHRIKRGLEIAGIKRIAEEFYFAATDHGEGKPAPDVFLHAARVFAVDPARCLVIEDSVFGVQGGRAAGMSVAGYIGGNHSTEGHADRLKGAGAQITTDDWSDIRDLVQG